jgi:hypothetical protein
MQIKTEIVRTGSSGHAPDVKPISTNRCRRSFAFVNARVTLGIVSSCSTERPRMTRSRYPFRSFCTEQITSRMAPRNCQRIHFARRSCLSGAVKINSDLSASRETLGLGAAV